MVTQAEDIISTSTKVNALLWIPVGTVLSAAFNTYLLKALWNHGVTHFFNVQHIEFMHAVMFQAVACLLILTAAVLIFGVVMFCLFACTRSLPG